MGTSYPYIASPQQSLRWPKEYASSVGHNTKSPPGMDCFGTSGERFLYLYRVTTMVWLSTTAVGPGTSTDIEGIISVGANMSTVAAKRAYLDAKSSNQTDSKEPPSIAASTRTDPEKARIVRTVTGINIQETTTSRRPPLFKQQWPSPSHNPALFILKDPDQA